MRLVNAVVPGAHAGSVRVDRGQCEQMLINLAVNTRAAIRDGANVWIVPGPTEKKRYRLPPGRLSGACVNADAATLFTALRVAGLLSSLLAFVATLGEVRSLFAMRACCADFVPTCVGTA